MLFNTLATVAGLAMAVSAAPTTTYPGPPVVYQTAPSAPLITATTLAAPAATGASKAKRDSSICYPQPAGISHKSLPDTDTAFSSDPYYAQQANGATTPLGFNKLFTNTAASLNAPGYAGFTLLDTYDVQTCANKCNAISGCTSFNIYFERDPSVDPNDPSCSNPASVTNIKCVWWTTQVTAAQNVNNGQYRGDFHVVIAGSNGYVGTAYQRGFKIKTAGSGTFLDNRWLQFSPGEGSAIALNPDKAFAGTFQLGADGSLIQLAPWGGNAAALWNSDGSNQLLTERTIGQSGVDYIKCGIDNIITCRSKAGYQVANVCPGNPLATRGLVYFGLNYNVPKNCYSIGLYFDSS